MKLGTSDKQEITELGTAYNRALDARNIEQWLATWTEDGVLESPYGTFRGRGALHGFLESFLEGTDGKRHWTANQLFEETDGEMRAQASCDLLVIRIGGTPLLLSSGRYADELRRGPGGWRFARRKLTFDSPATTLAGEE